MTRQSLFLQCVIKDLEEDLIHLYLILCCFISEEISWRRFLSVKLQIDEPLRAESHVFNLLLLVIFTIDTKNKCNFLFFWSNVVQCGFKQGHFEFLPPIILIKVN